MTTDAQAALAEMRASVDVHAAIAELRAVLERDVNPTDGRACFACWEDFWRVCTPANIATILAHVEAQKAEIERLTAALRHEADCVEAAKAEIERLQIGIELFDAADADLRTKLDAANDLAEMIASERDELRRQLAEAEQDARRYRWLRGEHKRVDPICAVIWKRNGDRNGSEWVNTANIDAEIDAAMGASNE